jgi:hypothetical protein
MRFKPSLLKTDALRKNKKSRLNANYSDSVLEKLVSLKICKAMTILKLTNYSKKSIMLTKGVTSRKMKKLNPVMTLSAVISLTTIETMTQRMMIVEMIYPMMRKTKMGIFVVIKTLEEADSLLMITKTRWVSPSRKCSLSPNLLTSTAETSLSLKLFASVRWKPW